MFVAHIRSSDNEEQPLREHLLDVQAICEKNGEKFELPSVFGLAGLLHDVGKYSDEFQQYIREAVANPLSPPKRGSVNHSTAGGKILMDAYHHSKAHPLIITMVEMISNAIYSHHGQLLDFVNQEGESPFLARTKNEKIPLQQVKERFFKEVMSEKHLDTYVLQARNEFYAFVKKHFSTLDKKQIVYKVSPPLTLAIYSSLIDADRINSREFDEGIQLQQDQSKNTTFQQYLQELEKSLQTMQEKAPKNIITKLRQQMSDNCYEKATLPIGVYSLSIPTGGGKTLASLRFALKHATLHGLERIIYVVPYTTIIEQNASAVRNILKTDGVLEHHSNVIEDIKIPQSYIESEMLRQVNNAKDNWDIPIVFTTMVQYLNTFYSGKSRDVRRMHNLAKSVIIFDEVQSVPIHCISLFNETINFLTKYADTTVMLCTATQPALQYVKEKIKVDAEIVENLDEIENAFKRTKIHYLNEKPEWTTEEVTELLVRKLKEVNSVLVITNNKKTTKALYKQSEHSAEYVYHLSTNMCPAHRKAVLKEMNQHLKAGKQVLCISTQLIEAGVDVSFQCVFRSLAGVDSIAQAAGRCNRNGEVKSRPVYVFKHAEENLVRLPTIEVGQRNAAYLLRDIEEQQIFNGEILSSEAISHYFKQYYTQLSLEMDFPVKGLSKSLHAVFYDENPYKKRGDQVYMHAGFETVSKYFEVIDGSTQSILVPYGNGADLIAQLTSGEKVIPRDFIKEAQQYSVNVFPHELALLKQQQLIRPVDFGAFQIWIALESAYDMTDGLSIYGDVKMDLLSL